MCHLILFIIFLQLITSQWIPYNIGVTWKHVALTAGRVLSTKRDEHV